MGFGYIFVGSVLTVNVVAHGYTDLIAYALILIGMMTLKDYGPRLKTAYYAAWPLLFVGLIELLLYGATFLGFNASTLFGFVESDRELLMDADLLNQVFLLIFTFLLLRGLRTLAKETDTFALESRVFRNQIFAVLYHVPMAFLNLSFENPTVNRVQNYMMFPFLLFGFVYLILQAKLIFSFYMWICPEEDINMERRPSKLGIINSLNRVSDKIDEKTVERKQREREEKQKQKESRRANGQSKGRKAK
jgi:hypothetical protein